MKKRQLSVLIIAVAIVIATFVGFAMRNGTSSMGTMKSGDMTVVSTAAVSIKGYMFGPMVIKVKAGTTVTWTNQDPVNHTITADTASRDAPNSMDIGQGKSYSFKFAKAGTYTYHCFPHPYMHGTVIVTG